MANTLSDRLTAEKIIDSIEYGWTLPPQIIGGQAVHIKRDHTATLFSPELETLVGASDWMLGFLCQAWDQDTYTYGTKNKGTNTIKDMCISLIGATVPDYIRRIDRNADASVAGGFTSRCVFVYADKKSKELPYAEPLDKNPKSYAKYQKLLLDLEHISKLKGEYTLSTGARMAFRNFYSETSPLAEDTDAVLFFKGRMKAHVHKLALILSASKHDSPEIREQEMKDAIWLVRQIKTQIARVFRGIGSSELAEPTARIQLAIEKHGMVTKRELLRTNMSHMTDETLGRVLYVLQMVGFCRTIRVNNIEYYAPVMKQKPNTQKGAKP